MKTLKIVNKIEFYLFISWFILAIINLFLFFFNGYNIDKINLGFANLLLSSCYFDKWKQTKKE